MKKTTLLLDDFIVEHHPSVLIGKEPTSRLSSRSPKNPLKIRAFFPKDRSYAQ